MQKGNGVLKLVDDEKFDPATYYVPNNLKDDLDGIIATVRNIDKFGTEMGDRNYILSGGPGTGKTLGVRYIAKQLGIPIYDGKNISTPQQVSEAFSQLREVVKGGNKAFLVLNEVDKYSSRDDLVDPIQSATLNQLLDEMDGSESNHGIFVFGTTNKADRMDAALRRTGRFSKEVEFFPPDKRGREAILAIHAYKKGHNFKVNPEDLPHIAEKTFGYTGGDIKGLLNEAFKILILRDEKSLEVTREDLEKALKRVKPSALRDMPFEEPRRKFNDIAGYELHKEIVRRIAEQGKGGLLLLYGPGGTGKTLMPEATAGEYGFSYIVVRGNEIEESLVGKTKDRLKRIIERAKSLAPCVVNLDEIRSLVSGKVWSGGTKEGHTGYLQSVLGNPPEGVLFFATENRPDILTDTLVQRFPHKIYFGMPTREEQIKIWEKYLPDSLNPEQIVEINSGLNGRDIAQAVQNVRDYGLEHTPLVYAELIREIVHAPESEYDEIKKKIGDGVETYRRIKRAMNGGNGNGSAAK